MERSGAIRVVEDEDELANRLASVWLESADDNDAQVARRFIETRRGATRRQLELLKVGGLAFLRGRRCRRLNQKRFKCSDILG